MNLPRSSATSKTWDVDYPSGVRRRYQAMSARIDGGETESFYLDPTIDATAGIHTNVIVDPAIAEFFDVDVIENGRRLVARNRAKTWHCFNAIFAGPPKAEATR